MDALTIAIRAVQYAAAVMLFGEFFFCLCIAPPARKLEQRGTDVALAVTDRAKRVGVWCLAALLASGVLWLAAEAASMSGAPLSGALGRRTLATVLTETLFGRLWTIRLISAGMLIATIAFFRRSTSHPTTIFAVCVLLSGALLGSLAWAGHATAEQGGGSIVHLTADALHLVAAGAWLGALPAFAFLLQRAERNADAQAIEFAARATRRFSALGLLSVATLALTGAVNAGFTVGSVPALLGTEYGRLLSLKLALFALMVSLAALNRLRLMPRLSSVRAEDAFRALERLRRNAIAETTLGLGVLVIVGALGVTIPALHVQTAWPLPFTLDWEVLQSSWPKRAVVLVVPLASLALALLGLSGRRRVLAIGGGSAFVAGLALCAWSLAVPAYPTTYFRSPVGYSTASIARGATLYVRHCALCHGEHGRGDGPAAASLTVRPADLTEHLLHHREGELLWWIEHGIRGTPMPAFGNLIDEGEIWDLLNFLRSRAEAAQATMSSSVEPWRPIVAPDFTFQIGHGEQETLARRRAGQAVLLVFYELPGSLARLRVLSDARAALERAGTRIVAVPMTLAGAAPPGVPGIDAAMLADPDPGIVIGYSAYRPAGEAAFSANHVEFLIDRQGYLRARWLMEPSSGWNSVPDLLRQAVLLSREEPHAQAAARHAHGER